MNEEALDIEKMLQTLTVEEKMRMLTGDGMWHTFGAGELPRVRMSDGPNGLRMESGGGTVPSVCYPTPSMLANSWDPALLFNVGAAIGAEATALGVNLVLAPGLNIKRSPLGGRNFEYYSEDPLLSGTLGRAFVSGVQSTGVGACVKHFAANNSEYDRMYADSVIDPRALHEVYLKPFEIAMASSPAAVMCAYNKLNGTYCSENELLLKKTLRDDWGYTGVTLSDWGAVHSRVRSLKAGLDLEMPDSLGLYKSELEDAFSTGEITEKDIDDSLRRILELIDNVYLEPYGDYDADALDRLSYQAAAESVVLLQNENNFLPLTKNIKLVVMGELAQSAPIQGEGSSHVTPLSQMSPLDAFAARAIDVKYCRGYSENAKENSALYDEAMTAACKADAVVVYAGTKAPSEGLDRPSMFLPPEQDALINGLIGGGHRVCVVLVTPGPVVMTWAKRVRSIIYAGLNGQNGALAAVDVLYGRVNPRGRLAETFPLTDELATTAPTTQTLYRESLFVGYRYYDAIERRVLFPFGHGLSFSQITYDEMHVEKTGANEFTVKTTVTNHSTRDCYETVQVYVSDCTGRVLAPQKQLAGFYKAFVEGGASVVVSVKLDKRAFEFWNEKKGAFSICDGQFKISVGASATDLKFTANVKIDGDYTSVTLFPDCYRKPAIGGVTDEAFKELYGSEFPAVSKAVKGEFTIDNCIADLDRTFIGKVMRFIVKRAGARMGEKREGFLAAALHTPFTAAISMSDGFMTESRALGIVTMANGRFFKGLRLFLKRKPKNK